MARLYYLNTTQKIQYVIIFSFWPSIIFYIPIITSTPLVSINSSSLNCYDAQQPEPFTTALVSFLSSLVPQSYKLSSVEVCIYELISLIKEKVIAN